VFQNAFQVLGHVGVGDTDYAQAFAGDHRGAPGIEALHSRMRIAVDFDHQSLRETQDVGKIRPDRRLVAPLEMWKRLPQSE
jgi:hypothetical protein